MTIRSLKSPGSIPSPFHPQCQAAVDWIQPCHQHQTDPAQGRSMLPCCPRPGAFVQTTRMPFAGGVGTGAAWSVGYFGEGSIRVRAVLCSISYVPTLPNTLRHLLSNGKKKFFLWKNLLLPHSWHHSCTFFLHSYPAKCKHNVNTRSAYLPRNHTKTPKCRSFERFNQGRKL